MTEPLFILPSNKSLTGSKFRAALITTPEELHLNSSHFSVHSFRIGATISTKQAGISDSYLKSIGHDKIIKSFAPGINKLTHPVLLT